MIFLYNNITLKVKRKGLRKNQTEVEKLIWRHVRNRQIEGLKFLRQYSIGPYILDFFCPEQRIAIELDGSQHGEQSQKQHDRDRQIFLEQQGIQLLRFWNDEVLKNINGVLEKIRECCSSHS